VNYEIVELEELSGPEATVYSIIKEGDRHTLFDHFIKEHVGNYREEIKFIITRLHEMGKITGAREQFFKCNEGKPGDGVCALYDEPGKQLRLYCIRYGKVAILLGSGGSKKRQTIAWQDDKKLTKEAQIIIGISKDITNRLKEGEIYWSANGSQLSGNLNFSDHE
jgi:putative component of toxin-antitoxin plasmid stabilization module